MRYNVVIDLSALERLENHVDFLRRVSASAAVKLADEFNECLNTLLENPGIYPRYESEINADLRYKLFLKRYRIVFEIIENDVYIYDVQDCRQDMDKNLL